MTDKELLELAAKAAGMNLGKWKFYDGLSAKFVLMLDGEPTSNWWNPLADDGDAMRLAVKAKIDIEHNDPWDNSPWVLASRRGFEGCFSPVSCIEDDFDEQHREAATRRAIVRVAAEIEMGMK